MMKKLSLFLVLCMLITCVLASCNSGSTGNGGENNGGENSDGEIVTPPVEEHKHAMVKIAKVEPSCKLSGTEAYFTCKDCGKLFSDAGGKNEISAPVNISALPHSWSEVKESEDGFFVECKECGTKESVPAPEADSYSAVKNNDFISDKGYQLEMHYGSNGVSHSGGTDKTNVDVGFMGGIDKVGEFVSYQFVMSRAGTVDLIWTVAGNNYSGGDNLGIDDMAKHMSITVDGKPVDVSGIDLPALIGGSYNEEWWMLQQIVIENIHLDAGVHVFKCEVIKNGGVNIDDLTVCSTQSLSSDMRANVKDVNLTLEGDRLYYHLTYDVSGYAPSDFEFFNGNTVYPFTYKQQGNDITFKFDFTELSAGTFYPHLRLQGVNWGHEKGDVILTYFENYNTAYTLNCRNYRLGIAYDMPSVFVVEEHNYVSHVVTAPTLTAAGKGEARCAGCGLVDERVGQIDLPPLSADNGYKVTEGAVTRYNYAAKVFTNFHTVFVFNFDIDTEDKGNKYSFDAKDLFGQIGSSTAQYNTDGYYSAKAGDEFVFVLKADSNVTVAMSFVDNLSAIYGADKISSITVNGRASETCIFGNSINLVLEKGTNTVKFVLKDSIDLRSVSFNSERKIDLINPDKAHELLLMSYNIRIDANSGYQDWDQRKSHLALHILSYSPDVICFQEVKKNQYQDLVALIGETYEIIWYGRQGGSNPEGLAVAYKKAEFTEVSRGMFWLSETPEVESMGWDAQGYLRIAVNAIITHNESGQTINVYSVHLDGHSREACHKSMELVMERASQYDYPVYIAGDFNANDLSYAHYVTDSNYHSAQYVAPTTEFSNTAGYEGNWIGVPNYTKRAIDHIFVSPEYFVPMEFKPCRDKWGDGYFHSDHLAIVSKVLLLTE